MHKVLNFSRLPIVFIFTFAFFPFVANAQFIEKGLSEITPQLIKEYVNFLASDEMKGRATPSKELDMAADYIASKFKSFGVNPVNGSYFQEIPFCAPILIKEKCVLKITKGKVTQAFELKKHYTPFFDVATGAANAPIVFAGYGITAPEYNYDDYAGLDVKGKIVLVLKHEPRENGINSIFDGFRYTPHADIVSKIENAAKHGASGFMLVTDPLNHTYLAPEDYSRRSLSNFINPQFTYEICADQKHIPAVHVGENVIDMLFNGKQKLINIQKHIDDSLKPNSFEMHGVKCELTTFANSNRTTAKNVVGIIAGSDPELKNEYIVLGGHYDHIGVKNKRKEGEDYIFNGADDNASGTAGVIAIAKALSAMKEKTKRSILLILFAGEELGLIGSEYYVNHPLIPLKNTVAMLNLDMISRNDKDVLTLEGTKYNPDLAKIIIEESKKTEFTFYDSPVDLYGSSDQYNFFKQKITAMSFFTGLHKDYHKVTDNPDKINAEKAAKVTQLAFRTLWRIANENKTYKTEIYESLFN